MSTKENSINVSIIVLLYNADRTKLERTVRSIINQQSVNFEVIVSDDGSKSNPHDMVLSIFDQYQYTNYTFNRNEKNVGTVKNILSALELAKGKYIYLISPGDLIFDGNTMKDFFDFAEENQSTVCFGDYIPYNIQNNRVEVFEDVAHPPAPSVYETPHSFFESKVYALGGAGILGPTFFRKKEYATRYFTFTSQASKYVEDNTSTVFSMAENVPIQHCNRKICWYEQGSGISTSANYEWQKLIEKDFFETFTLAKKMYPKDRVIRALYSRRFGKYANNRALSLLQMFIKHPRVFYTYIKLGRIPKTFTKCSASQLENLKEMLQDEAMFS